MINKIILVNKFAIGYKGSLKNDKNPINPLKTNTGERMSCRKNPTKFVDWLKDNSNGKKKKYNQIRLNILIFTPFFLLNIPLIKILFIGIR